MRVWLACLATVGSLGVVGLWFSNLRGLYLCVVMSVCLLSVEFPVVRSLCVVGVVLFGTLYPGVWEFLFVSFGWVVDSVVSGFYYAGWVGWLVYLGFVASGESSPPCVRLCLGKLQGKRWGPSGRFHFFFWFPFLLFPFTLLILCMNVHRGGVTRCRVTFYEII